MLGRPVVPIADRVIPGRSLPLFDGGTGGRAGVGAALTDSESAPRLGWFGEALVRASAQACASALVLVCLIATVYVAVRGLVALGVGVKCDCVRPCTLAHSMAVA